MKGKLLFHCCKFELKIFDNFHNENYWLKVVYKLLFVPFKPISDTPIQSSVHLYFLFDTIILGYCGITISN